jgi:hypothetical protein
MGDVSLLEGVAKKFLNMVPRQFYREAAQKLVYEICETIYKDLDEKERFPRVEIIDIVEKFVKTHLGNPPENPNENPMGIRDAISDVLKKTTLEVYKDDLVNKLLLKNILLDEFDKEGKVTTKGNFYKSLEQSILYAKDPILKNRLKKELKEAATAVNEGAKAIGRAALNGASNMLPKIDKQKVFAKNVLAALPNVDIDNPPAPSAGPTASADPTAPASADSGSASGASASGAAPGADSATAPAADSAITSDNKANKGGKKQVGGLQFNPMAIAGTALAAAAFAKEAGIIGNKSGSGSGSGSGNGGTTNIGYEPNKNGVLPYIQTNCNGSGLGLPGINLNFLSKFLDGLKEPIAEELIKKIQERLPESTIDSITVKRNIYDKILLVIQAHLQSQQGKDMLLGHIKTIVEPEIKFLTQDNEVKKRLIKVIFKNKSSEIYKKLIDIIASNTTRNTAPPPTKDDKNCNCNDKSGKKTDTSKTSPGNAVLEINEANKDDIEKNQQSNETLKNAKLGGGGDGEKTDASAQNTTVVTNENNAEFTTDITKVIEELNEFINVDINTFDGFPEVKKSIKEAAIAQFKIALVDQQKKMEVDSKNNEENAKKANEEGIKKIALGSVQSKIDEIKQKEKEAKDFKDKNTRFIVIEKGDGKEEVRPPSPARNGGNNRNQDNIQPNEEDKIKDAAVKEIQTDIDESSKSNEIRGGILLENSDSTKVSAAKDDSLLNLKSKNNTNNHVQYMRSKDTSDIKGGNPTKNKTKRRRTKNNTRKMKQKRRTIKKT